MKDKIDVLREVYREMDRFRDKLTSAIKEQSTKGNYSNRHYASVKRAALDLKNELTKLTQGGILPNHCYKPFFIGLA
jgi:hypothetical protein